MMGICRHNINIGSSQSVSQDHQEARRIFHRCNQHPTNKPRNNKTASRILGDHEHSSTVEERKGALAARWLINSFTVGWTLMIRGSDANWDMCKVWCVVDWLRNNSDKDCNVWTSWATEQAACATVQPSNNNQSIDKWVYRHAISDNGMRSIYVSTLNFE